MPDLNEMDLLREYADSGSETAFAGLVQRHINLVYSVALRYTGNSPDAQDVTQAVFIILAQKAASLRQRTTLTGWLYETTRFTGIRHLRNRTRQQAREQEAYMQSTLNNADAENLWRQLAPILEDAMSRLNEKERTLLALRFFENKSGAETAALLGIQEWAVHKRAARALEKLRKYFSKRGVTSTAATLATTISANSIQSAPALLAKTVTAVALVKGATASLSTLTLIKGALKIMAWTKMKTAIVAGVVVILAVGPACWWLWRPQVVTLRDGTKLTLVGVTYGRRQAWPVVKPPYSERTGAQAFGGTGNDTLVVWLRKKDKSDNPPDFQVYAQDISSTACAPSSDDNSRDINDREQMLAYRLDVYPRREGKLYLRIMQDVHGKPVEAGKFVISNPAHGPFQNWPAEPLPDTQLDGDLSVTLAHLGFGPTTDGDDNLPKTDPINQFVIASFQFEQNGVAATNWDLVSVETSDATGNQTDADNINAIDGKEPAWDYQWGLWPEEPAWKLHAEFSETSGFSGDELWSVTNLPIELANTNAPIQRDTNATAFAETAISGSNLEIFPARQLPANPARNRGLRTSFRIHVEPLSDDMHLTLVKVTDDQNREIRAGGAGENNGDFIYQLRNLTNVQSINVTLALHRNRFVDFTVKPAKQ